MTVKELIEKLKTYPDDLRVVVKGYEGGYDDIDRFMRLNITLDYHEYWYYGAHEDASSAPDKPAVSALCLAAENRD